MKILIVTNDTKVHTYQRLIEECGHLNIETQTFNPQKISQPLPFQNSADLILNRFTAVMGSDLDLDLLATIDQSRCINQFDGLRITRSKLAQQMFFEKSKPTCIPTYFIQGEVNQSSVIKFLQSNGDIFITKPIRGNGGRGMTLFESHRSLLSYLETCHITKDQGFIIQPFVSSNIELRIFMINYKPYLIIKKNGKLTGFEFRRNLSRVNDIQLMETKDLLSEYPSLLPQCEKMGRELKLKLCAFDVIIDEIGSFKFLEINAVPGWSYLELYFKSKNIDKNITKEILKHIVE